MSDEQERTLEGMRITRTGRGMYSCHSETHPERAYSVDLMEHDGLGSCTCDDFMFRRYPRYKTAKVPYDTFRCKHLRRVRGHVLDQIIKHMIQREEA